MHDFNGSLSQALLLSANSYNASANGVGVDVSGYEGVLKVLVDLEVISGTTPTAAVKLQTSADNTNWTDVAGAVTNTATNTGTSGLQAVGVDTRDLIGYLRPVLTITGTTPVVMASASLVGESKYR